MCPNHVEHALVSKNENSTRNCKIPFQDTKLLTSISATERVKLWDRFTGPIDQDAVKLEFFRKIHRENPPFRYKVRLAPRNRSKIPPMVQYHYKKPTQLLPSLRDALRLHAFYENQKTEIKEEPLEAEECKMNGAIQNGQPDCNSLVLNGAVNSDKRTNSESSDAECKSEIMKEAHLPDILSDISTEGECWWMTSKSCLFVSLNKCLFCLVWLSLFIGDVVMLVFGSLV